MDLSNLRESLLKNGFGRLFLKFAAFCYGLGVKFNTAAYKNGWRKSKQVNTRVVCIGNITTGGTGKTTAVIMAAAALAKGGVRVSVVSRGYKRKGKDIAVLFDNELMNWRETGDEPYMISQLLAKDKVPVVVSADRFAACQEALKQFKSQVILLDDGFQHHKLKRDADIVLIDAKNPFGGGALLPFGTLREPVTALKRAALAVITHSDLVPEREVEEIRDRIRLINDDIEILEAAHKPAYFFDLVTREAVPLSKFKNVAAAAFSAIGEPQSFEDTLRRLGVDLKQAWRYPDHSEYTLERLQALADMRGDLPLITTFKDAVKMPEGWQEVIKGKVYLLAIDMEIGGGGMKQFVEVLFPGFSKKK